MTFHNINSKNCNNNFNTTINIHILSCGHIGKRFREILSILNKTNKNLTKYTYLFLIYLNKTFVLVQKSIQPIKRKITYYLMQFLFL